MIHVVQVFRHFKRGTPGFKMTLPAIKDISEIFQVLYSWTEKASSGVVSSTKDSLQGKISHFLYVAMSHRIR